MFYIKLACHCFWRRRKFLILNYFFTSYHLFFWQMDEINFIGYLKVASFQKWRRNLINQCRYHILQHYSFSSYMYKKILTIYFDSEIKNVLFKNGSCGCIFKKVWLMNKIHVLLFTKMHHSHAGENMKTLRNKMVDKPLIFFAIKDLDLEMQS